VKAEVSSVIALVGEAFSLGVRVRCPLACFHKQSAWKLSRFLCRVITYERILFSLKCRSVEVAGCGSTSGGVSTWVSRVLSSMTHCCASRRTFICISNWWLTYVTTSRSRSAVSRWMVNSSRSRSALARCSSKRRRRLTTIWTSCPRERTDGLNSSVMGGVLVHHGHGARVFSWKGMGIGWGEILSKDSETLNKSTKCCE